MPEPMALDMEMPGDPLQHGRLVRRYKRFLADIQLDDGTAITAHCPNSGSMMGLKEPGFLCQVRHVDDPKRKLKWTWELVSPDAGGTWVGINTMRPNQVVEEMVRSGRLARHGLSPDHGVRREVKYGDRSRIDLLLGDDASELTYVEVKNTTLAAWDVAGRDPDPVPTAVFPDAVTARGTKHMHELAAMAEAGHQAVVVFFVNRGDCRRFDVAREIDPVYADSLDAAFAAGVRVLPLGMQVDARGWRFDGVLPSPLTQKRVSDASV